MLDQKYDSLDFDKILLKKKAAISHNLIIQNG